MSSSNRSSNQRGNAQSGSVLSYDLWSAPPLEWNSLTDLLKLTAKEIEDAAAKLTFVPVNVSDRAMPFDTPVMQECLQLIVD